MSRRQYIGGILAAIAGIVSNSAPAIATMEARFHQDWRLESFLVTGPLALTPLLPTQPGRGAQTKLFEEVSKDGFMPRARIAIIIDDLGNQWRSGLRALRLPGPVPLAILPDSHWGRRLAERAHNQEREVILHVPMEPDDATGWENGLTTTMDEGEFRLTLENMLRAFPQARGINNHMGSRLTRDRTRMDWAVRVLAERELFFVDSRTTPETEGFTAALAGRVPAMERDVFLDHDRTETAIETQWRTLLDIAVKDGYALAIGHPYPETLEVLERNLPTLAKLGIELVDVSAMLMHMKQNLTTAERCRVAANRWRDGGNDLSAAPLPERQQNRIEQIPILLNPWHLKSI